MDTAHVMCGMYPGNPDRNWQDVAGDATRVLSCYRTGGQRNKPRQGMSMSTSESRSPFESSGKNQRMQAPFTSEQINKLLWWQQNMHPYTCPNRGDGKHRDDGALVPQVEGFICKDCDYVQTWAHFVTI